jgi:conjugative relaxase-like TrwC/TraI family protein
MTAQSIGAGKAAGTPVTWSRRPWLRNAGTTTSPRRGSPPRPPDGGWRRLTRSRGWGSRDRRVEGRDFISLMEGKHPRSGRWLRRAGANSERSGGIDLTFSAPKSVSTLWALGDRSQRADMEAAHAAAVRDAMSHLTEMVPTIRRSYSGQIVEERAADLIAAEYRHTTSRGVIEGDAPDPQLHSHVVATSAVRDDGKIVAVASRPIFRSAREVGAYYRSALAHELQQRGYGVERGGKQGRYFEIVGVPRGLLDAFSARSREVARAAERFRARYGRAPERGELRRLKLENRKAKTPVTPSCSGHGMRPRHGSTSLPATCHEEGSRTRHRSVRWRIVSKSVWPSARRRSGWVSCMPCCWSSPSAR